MLTSSKSLEETRSLRGVNKPKHVQTLSECGHSEFGPVVQFDVHHIAVPRLSLRMHSTVKATPDLVSCGGQGHSWCYN